MALHPNFPKSRYAILDPDIRWFPADEELRERGYDGLLPPLIATLRDGVYDRLRTYHDRGRDVICGSSTHDLSHGLRRHRPPPVKPFKRFLKMGCRSHGPVVATEGQEPKQRRDVSRVTLAD